GVRAEGKSAFGQEESSSALQLPTALSGGLLALLGAASGAGALPLQANATVGATPPARDDVDQVEDRTPRRYVSGIADQMRGAASNDGSRQFAYKTNCDEAYTRCLGTIKDMRSASKCRNARTRCENGFDTIFPPGIWGQRGG